ncbi:protein mono-ADP-ribosyltransferase TIPARP [Anoplopoma fimbria]|uniref:protein mono-ADP-ribosyltransferase TIPARP n=1 Tax=Anoplopoma fimbria TaxID=229290 RepID=UPI0023EB698C|nr:protein mono-ADP-ribosyltransferase TIPARP [Anoplopoma fimbria]
MDKSLHILQKSADGVPTGISLDMSLNMDEGEGFTEQRIVGLPDKIPLVKPYFKKKQRKLDPKCLHRALEDPILTTLLRTDALVSGDGVFVPRNPPGRTPGNLCAAVVVKQNCMGQVCLKDPGAANDTTAGSGVPVLMTRDCDVEIADTTAELEETERRGERPKVPDPTPEGRSCFQPKPSLRAAGSTVTIPPPGRDIPPTVAPQALHQEGSIIKSNDLLTSGSTNPPVKACAGVQDPLPLLLLPDKGVLFQDKSEEASLDLVFELLTQLQYHTHQSDSVDICVDFLQGLCVYGNDCAHHHTVLPYHWQIRRSSNQTWQSIADDSQEQLERLYCNPDNEQVRLKFQGRVFSLDFGAMRVCDLEFDRVRRLTTPASPLPTPTPATNPNPTPSCHTVWKYYCRDNFGWREYSEPVVKLIEEASSRGLKEVRFITLQNQYILNIREGFQQNAVFGFRRQIKKRPTFMSSVMLTPHLQTLGGLSSSPLSCSSSSSSSMDLSVSHPLSPTTTNPPSLFPETWLPMTMSQDFLQVPVSREDRSYRTVYSLFHKTVSETKFRILKIQRVQNPFLWEKYKRKKEYMSRRMSEMDRLLSERHLFHGTSADVVEGICKHNFDPRVCGKHATMFGQGSYFARKAVYSHNFSKRSPKGVHCMFLAKVLTGRFTVGNPSMRRPPPINLRDPSSDLYDSCVDNWVDPQIYVIFNDDQSYPYFIIHYEEVPSTVAV